MRLTRPSEAAVRRALDDAARRPLSYGLTGMTRHPQPPGWPSSGIRAPLGRGAAAWQRAVAALDRWAQYRTGWTWLYPQSPAIREGELLAAVARHYGLWSVNCCRVVYAPAAPDSESEHAYAIGTLDIHAETGEERFAVERAPDETVWFALTTYARAHHPLARLAPALVRRVQHRFARDAAAAMRRMLGT